MRSSPRPPTAINSLSVHSVAQSAAHPRGIPLLAPISRCLSLCLLGRSAEQHCARAVGNGEARWTGWMEGDLVAEGGRAKDRMKAKSLAAKALSEV